MEVQQGNSQQFNLL